MIFKYFSVAVICLSFIACKTPNTDSGDELKVFQLLSTEKTGIDFQNTIEETPAANLLLYEYLYNGGGVAAGDLNGDGLDDLYFTSNMQGNKLYLNRGSMQFTDITNEAGIAGREGAWKTGVSFVDVNADGRLDIFVCYSGNGSAELRKKQLFINEGNNPKGMPQFTDKAAEYGLDNTSTSTQAAFFDYDRDGDLDLFLLNHNIHNLPVLNIVQAKEVLNTEDPISGVRLFRQDIKNNKPFFIDVTKTARLSSSPLSFGLGVGIADINQDGWQDIYISNDYSAPDCLYINDKKGGFNNTINSDLDYFSQFSMGNDIADMNNDGAVDIFTLDMLPEDNKRQKMLMGPDNIDKFNLNVASGFGKQYMRNMLHLNVSNQNIVPSTTNKLMFSEIGQLAGISNTDWSWAALWADYDNDGWKDLYITNGFLRDFTNMDFLKYMNTFIAENQNNMSREKVLEIVSKMPASNVVNYLYHNQGNLTFKNRTKDWGLDQPANSNGAVYTDLDNDGDLDLVTNNINKAAFIYENNTNKSKNFIQINLEGNGKNSKGIGAKIWLYSGGLVQFQEAMPCRGYQSSVSHTLHFGLGKSKTVDSVKITWLAGKSQILKQVPVNQRLTLKEVDANTKINHTLPANDFYIKIPELDFVKVPENTDAYKRQPLITLPFTNSALITAHADLNADGLEDLHIGGGTNQAGILYFQTKNGKYIKKIQAIFEQDKACYDTDAQFFDANNDGKMDLYVCSGGYGAFENNATQLQDRLYINDGKGGFYKAKLPAMEGSKSCVRTHDINQDGLIDIFVGGRVVVGGYPQAPRSYVLINNGNGSFVEQTPKNLQYLGMVTDAQWHDIDHDNQKELIVVGEAMPITIFSNKKGIFENVTEKYFDKNYAGFWNKIFIEDLDNDNNPELLIGNLGNNSQIKATENTPINLYFGDFDQNGTIDPILTQNIMGKEYPYPTRDELIEQLPMFRKKFTNYEAYAQAGIEEILAEIDQKLLKKLPINCTKTMYFKQNKAGKFMEKPLPQQAQFSPIMSIKSIDYNRDGKPDLLLSGSLSNTRPKLGDMMANKGVVLKNIGNGKFDYVGMMSK